MKTIVNFATAFLLVLTWACSDDDDDTGHEVEPPQDVVVDTLAMGEAGAGKTYELDHGVLYQYSAGYGAATYAYILEMFSEDYDADTNTGDRLSFYFPTSSSTSIKADSYKVADSTNPGFVHADLAVGDESFKQLGGTLTVERTGEEYHLQWILQGNRIGNWPPGSQQVYVTGSFDGELDFKEVHW